MFARGKHIAKKHMLETNRSTRPVRSLQHALRVSLCGALAIATVSCTSPATCTQAALDAPASIPTTLPRATVWIFMSTDCPICNGYQPEIARLRNRFAPLGIEFVGVYAEIPVTQAEVNAHLKQFAIAYPVRIDNARALQRAFAVRVVPEIVVTAGGNAQANPNAYLYRGRIDNQYPERGSRQPSATVHDLERALGEIVKSQQPSTRTTTPVGCVLEPLS